MSRKKDKKDCANIFRRLAAATYLKFFRGGFSLVFVTLVPFCGSPFCGTPPCGKPEHSNRKYLFPAVALFGAELFPALQRPWDPAQSAATRAPGPAATDSPQDRVT